MTELRLIDTLIKINVVALKDGLALLSTIKGEQYNRSFKPAFKSTLGAHFRHMIEHYQCFLLQINSPISTKNELHITYDSRKRNQLVEINIEHAIDAIKSAIEELETINKLGDDVHYKLVDIQLNRMVETNIERELLFLHSHTVHHYAIIAAMARGFGIKVEDGFGVAIATQSYIQND